MIVRRVSPGSPFQPRATEWNAIADAVNDYNAKRVKAGAANRGRSSAPDPVGTVLVQNVSGFDYPRFAILGITGSIFGPADLGWDDGISLTVDLADSEHVGGRFVVLQEPILDEGVGRALLTGPTVCQVDVTDDTHEFADVEPGYYSRLASTDVGPAYILARQSGLGVKWAIVVLNMLRVHSA